VITRSGIVHINSHTIELPEAEARTLFLAAVAMTKRPGALAISTSTMLAITAATQVSITINDGFAEEYNPQGVLDQLLRGRAVNVV
jgi:hypothetical protein